MPKGWRGTLLALALFAPRASYAEIGRLPDLGHASGVVMSRAQQTRFGEAFLRQAKASLRFVRDPEAQAFVRRLGRRLVLASPSPQIRFHFYILRNPVINAFSVPGGYVFINSGAILAARNEDELAAVMAHEISHDTQRHIPRLIALSKRLSWAALAGVLAGVALMSSSQFEGGAAALSLSSAGLTAETLKHRRGYESEADHIGLRTMARAGFNPRAMAAFFSRLKTDDQFVSVNVPDSWRTHPPTDIRIAEAENLAARYPYTPFRDHPAFDRVRMGLLAEEGGPHEALARLKAEPRNGDPSARRYGLALVDLRLGEFAAARSRLVALSASHPRVVAYRLGLADWELDRGHIRRAAADFAQAARLKPHSLWLRILSVRAQLQSGADSQGLKEAKRLVARHPSRASLYRLLAHAFALNHDYLHAHEALAESHYLDGSARAARQELRLATPFATTASAKGRLATLTSAMREHWTVPPAFP